MRHEGDRVRVVGAFLAFLAAVGALAACSSGSTASAPPPTGPTIAGGPLDLSTARATPCALARPDQLAQYRLRAPGTPIPLSAMANTADAAGSACAWTPGQAGLPSYRAGIDQHAGALATLERRPPGAGVVTVTSVSEYPAVDITSGRGAAGHGRCTVKVGVASDTVIVADVTVPDPRSLDYADPCPTVEQFAATVIANSEGQAP
jgi:hypothetical protein